MAQLWREREGGGEGCEGALGVVDEEVCCGEGVVQVGDGVSDF